MVKMHPRRIVVLLAAVALLAGACGGGVDSADVRDDVGGNENADTGDQARSSEVDDDPSREELETVIDDSAPQRCYWQLLTEMGTALDAQDPTNLARAYGTRSPVWRPVVALYTDTIRIQYATGFQDAYDFTKAGVADLCLRADIANHVLGLAPGDEFYMTPDVPMPESPAPVPYEPAETAAADNGTADYGTLLVSAKQIGTAALDNPFDEVVDKLGLDGLAPRTGPIVSDYCGNGDASVYWDGTGVTLRSDSSGAAFAYLLRRHPPDTAAGLPIDIDGTGLGWGAARTDLEAAFGPSDDYPNFVLFDLSDGPIQVQFDDSGELDAVQAGGDCSSGG